MAVNLNPGADATLVAAATRAAMADVPKDQAQIWQNMSIEKGKAYEAWGEAGAEAAKLFMDNIGSEMLVEAYKKSSLKQGIDAWRLRNKLTGAAKTKFEEAIKNHKIRRDGGTVNINGEDVEIDGWKSIKDKEERKEAKRLWEEQGRKNLDQYTAFVNKTLVNTNSAASDMLNQEATGTLGALKQGALQANGDWFGPEVGNRVRMIPEIDQNGDLQFYLESEKGGYITGVNADGSYQIETTYDDAGAIVTGGPTGDKPLPGWAVPQEGEDDSDQETTSQKQNIENLSQKIQNLPQSVKNALTALPTTEEDITTLQNDLLSLGYKLPKWGADGEMDSETRNALLDFKNDLNNVNSVIEQVGQKRLSVSIDDIDSLVVTRDQEKRNALNQLDLDALNGKTIYRKNGVMNQVLDALGNDINAWRDIFHARLANNDKTYAEMLKTPSDLSATVFESLANLGAKDADGDGDVDADDFVGNSADVQKNMAIMTNTLLDPSNPLAKKAFADWYSDQVGKSALDYIKRVEEQRKKKNKEEEEEEVKFLADEKSMNINNPKETVELDGSIVETVYDNLLGGRKGGTFHGYTGNADGSWTKGEQTLSGRQFLEYISNLPEYQGFDFRRPKQFQKFMTNIGGTTKSTYDLDREKWKLQLNADLGKIEWSKEDDPSLNDKALARKLNKIEAFTKRGYKFGASSWDNKEQINIIDTKTGETVKTLEGGKGENEDIIKDIISFIYPKNQDEKSSASAQELIDKYSTPSTNTNVDPDYLTSKM